MKTMVVWLLISVSNGHSYNQGTLTVVGKFPTQETCVFVQNNLPNASVISTRCIQSTIVQESQ